MKTFQIIILLLCNINFSIAQTQSIDTAKSVIEFKISNLGLNTVKGIFKNMTGSFYFNTNNLEDSNFDICIEVKTVNTGNEKRDEHLKSSDFFNIETHPNICFKSDSVIKKDYKYLVKGNLTMHGHTKMVEIPFEFTNNTFSGSFELERLDYGIGKDTGTFMVGSTAKINITCVLK